MGGELVSQMSKQELIDLVTKAGFGTVAIPSVGKPRCMDLDGTAGITTTILSSSPGNATSYPSASTLSQTWNLRLAYEYGAAIAKEANALGMQGWYAPGANLHRTPIGGRNYEYFSEDPRLSGRLIRHVRHECKKTVASIATLNISRPMKRSLVSIRSTTG